MNWEAIGILAEIIGAVAVIITLIYLSVQMRLGREATQAQSSYSAIDIYGAWRSHMIENRDLAESIAKANRGERVLDEENIQLRTLMDDLFLATATAHVAGLKSNVLYDSSADVKYIERILRQNPGLVPFWGEAREYLEIFFPEFVEAVDTHLNEKGIAVESADVSKNWTSSAI